MCRPWRNGQFVIGAWFKFLSVQSEAGVLKLLGRVETPASTGLGVDCAGKASSARQANVIQKRLLARRRQHCVELCRLNRNLEVKIQKYDDLQQYTKMELLELQTRVTHELQNRALQHWRGLARPSIPQNQMEERKWSE